MQSLDEMTCEMISATVEEYIHLFVSLYSNLSMNMLFSIRL